MDLIAPDSKLENKFVFIINNGLWKLREEAELFTFDQSTSWDAATAFHSIVWDDDEHECTEGDGCISWDELLDRI